MPNIKEKLVELIMECEADVGVMADYLISKGVTIKTNADRIRAMSDEELAATMYGLTGLDEHIQFCQNKAECEVLLEKDEEIPDQDCIRCLVAWLKQPAEEVHHD